MTDDLSVARTAVSPRRLLVPLALAQFICSFAGSNMNVMINDISNDLDTTVQGVQTAITLFLLVMAALMIPGSKLSDRWGRKRCCSPPIPCRSRLDTGGARAKLAPTATMGRVDARHTVLASPTTTFEDEAASDFLSDAL